MQTVLVVIGLLSGLLGTIYALYTKYQQALRKLADYQAQDKVKDNILKIAEGMKHIKETEIDFDKAVEDFTRNNTDK